MDIQHQAKDQYKEKIQKEHTLVLFNDEVNTFDFVIDVLCTVCDHSEVQAEQCAWITHFKGKCEVMNGAFDELKEKGTLMSEVGLTVEIH